MPYRLSEMGHNKEMHAQKGAFPSQSTYEKLNLPNILMVGAGLVPALGAAWGGAIDPISEFLKLDAYGGGKLTPLLSTEEPATWLAKAQACSALATILYSRLQKPRRYCPGKGRRHLPGSGLSR